eukprot:CAMPEP_0184871310 /NCGR_PEP_ID=MMETSP0580-20130426/40645_1 /TAXON_ID=1118495 /ORGANISM="Dactyliosolen fragilissimus" /LENGTH=85 /DNA_ID=CAMNT_0027373953 /DNA_START=188 /DNA_END=445 /DNA_ORIENTATION=+
MTTSTTSYMLPSAETISFSHVIESSPSVDVAAATIDPTTALSQLLGGVLGSPLILAVPILAAVAVASILAWGIVAYANPADPDDD